VRHDDRGRQDCGVSAYPDCLTTTGRFGRPVVPAPGTDSEIDYFDIPPLSDEQLAQFRRAPKVLVAARLDRDVYDWLKQYGEGYSTRINNILRAVMSRAR
jgi:uncharacterized protein (DUF4415 family)